MRDVYDYAKFLLKQEDTAISNTFDGNMKLQKLLVLANMVSLAKYGEELFKDKVLAFENGYVVENVRLRYKNDYPNLKKESNSFTPDFTEKEYDVLNCTLGLFGNLSAKELSELTHTFKSWQEAFRKGTIAEGFHDKDRSEVDLSAATEDIQCIRNAVEVYEADTRVRHKTEIINGVTFYVDGVDMTDEVISELNRLSLICKETSYTVHYRR